MNYTILYAMFIVNVFMGQNIGNNKKSDDYFISKPNNKEVIMENKKNFTSTIIVDAAPEEVFEAVKDFRAWWSEDIEGNTDKLNETFSYHYKNIHLCKIKFIEAVPSKKLVYQVVDNYFNFVNDQSEWVNTKLIFEIGKEGNKTKVTFTHEGLVPEYECYNVCYDEIGRE